MSIRRRLLALIVALVGALAVGSTAGADTIPQAGGANNVVVVSTDSQSPTLAQASTQIAPVPGPTVGSTNVAVATATDCTGCHSTAVAVQAIFVVGSPQNYVPGNAAAAANGGCSFCVSFAYAWQYLVQVSGPVHLTPTGQAEVSDLRQKISDAASTPINSLADATALCTQLNDLTSQLKSVVDTQLVASGVLATGTPNEHVAISSPDLNTQGCL